MPSEPTIRLTAPFEAYGLPAAYDRFLTTTQHVAHLLRLPPWREQIEAVAYHLLYRDFPTFWIVGVGKNAPLAQGAVGVLHTLGIPARWAPVTDLLHGGLGIYSPRDAMLVLSKSGATEELLTLMRVLPANGGRLLCTMSLDSPLSRYADLLVFLPRAPEGDSADLVPLMSVLTFHLFLHLVIIHLVALEGITYQTVLQAHPAGAIGQQHGLIDPTQRVYPQREWKPDADISE